MTLKSPITLLVAIVVLGIVLRSWQVNESFWIDELHTSWTVSGSLTQVAERAALGNQSPLYFWLAWFFARLPLTPEVSLRLPSMIAGCGLPIAIYWLAKQFRAAAEKSLTEVGAILATALAAIDPSAIFYSQEARPYALLQLAAVIHFGLLLQILKRSGKPPRVGWVITGALLVHLHYTGGLILVAEFVALTAMLFFSNPRQQDAAVCNPRGDGVRMCSSCWLDLGALALLVLPAIPGLLAVAARRGQWQDMVPTPPLSELVTLFPYMIAVVAFWLPKMKPVLSRGPLVILTCWGLFPLVVAWILTRSEIAPLYFARYLVAAWPASMIAAGLFPLSLQPRGRVIYVVLMLAWGIYSSELIQNVWTTGRPMTARREDWRTAVAELNTELKEQPEPVLVGSGLLEADELPERRDFLFREYCLLAVRGTYRLEAAEIYPLRRTEPGQLDAATAEQLAKSPGLWLLIRGNVEAHDQIIADVRQSLGGFEWTLVEPPRVFGNVYWLRLKRTDASVPSGL